MPFELRNAAQTFQWCIDQVIRVLHICFAYIDGILVATATPEQDEVHLRQLFQRLLDHALKINAAKCEFRVDTMDFWHLPMASSRYLIKFKI